MIFYGPYKPGDKEFYQVLEVDNNIYSHKIITQKYDTFENSKKIGFYGLGIHFGIEIEFEIDGIKEDFFGFLDEFSQSELCNFFLVSPEPSISNGVEFVSAPMNIVHHKRYLPLLYDFLKNKKVKFITSTNTGIHFHLTKEKIKLENIIEYLSSNTLEIDKFAGRKQNMYCIREFGNLKTKTNALRETETTIEIRIFKTFETAKEILDRMKIIERIL